MGTFRVDPHEHMTEAQVRRRARQLSRALFKETEQRERFEEELECVHKWLDDRKVPRTQGDRKYSTVGRIMWLLNPK